MLQSLVDNFCELVLVEKAKLTPALLCADVALLKATCPGWIQPRTTPRLPRTTLPCPLSNSSHHASHTSPLSKSSSSPPCFSSPSPPTAPSTSRSKGHCPRSIGHSTRSDVFVYCSRSLGHATNVTSIRYEMNLETSTFFFGYVFGIRLLACTQMSRSKGGCPRSIGHSHWSSSNEVVDFEEDWHVQMWIHPPTALYLPALVAAGVVVVWVTPEEPRRPILADTSAPRRSIC